MVLSNKMPAFSQERTNTGHPQVLVWCLNTVKLTGIVYLDREFLPNNNIKLLLPAMIFQSAALSQNVTIQNMYDNDNVEVTAAAGKMNRCKKKMMELYVATWPSIRWDTRPDVRWAKGTWEEAQFFWHFVKAIVGGFLKDTWQESVHWRELQASLFPRRLSAPNVSLACWLVAKCCASG